MPLKQVTVELQLAEGVQFALSHTDEWRGWTTTCSVEKIIFPEETTWGSQHFFDALRTRADQDFGIWPHPPHNATDLAEQLSGKVVVEVLDQRDTEELLARASFRLFPCDEDGNATATWIWNDRIKSVIAPTAP